MKKNKLTLEESLIKYPHVNFTKENLELTCWCERCKEMYTVGLTEPQDGLIVSTIKYFIFCHALCRKTKKL